MEQTKTESLIENILNVGSGFLISLLLWIFVITPLFGFDTTMVDNVGITLMFTTISVVRGYMWRRFFNNGVHKTVHKLVRSYYE